MRVANFLEIFIYVFGFVGQVCAECLLIERYRVILKPFKKIKFNQEKGGVKEYFIYKLKFYFNSREILSRELPKNKIFFLSFINRFGNLKIDLNLW